MDLQDMDDDDFMEAVDDALQSNVNLPDPPSNDIDDDIDFTIAPAT